MVGTYGRVIVIGVQRQMKASKATTITKYVVQSIKLGMNGQMDSGVLSQIVQLIPRISVTFSGREFDL